MPKEKKKSKKQKKKELEEKRRLEEELLRQQQEEERKRQEELERQRREEEERQRLLREKKRAEELVRLEKEREEDVEVEEQWTFDLARFELEQHEQSEWRKHLKCSTMPDISKEKEMNDFLTEWKEYSIFQHIDHQFDIDRLQEYLLDVERGYNLLSILQDVVYDAIQRRDADKMNHAKFKYAEIGRIAQNKIDVLTQRCLKDSVFCSVADSGMKEDGDVMRHGMTRHFKFGLWASSMVNSFKNSKLSFPAPISVKIELPKQIAMRARQPLSCRAVQFAQNLQVADGGQFECISPVIDVELLRLPMAPRSVYDESSGWMVQDVTEEADTPTVWGHCDEDGAVALSFVVPRYVVVADPEKIQIGWWHSGDREWRVGDVDDVQYEVEQRVLSVTTRRLSPLCMVQPIGTLYEYSEWKLTPSGVGRCKIWLLTASKLIVELEVVAGHCQLLQPELPALQHLLRKLMSPHQLIGALRDCGVNLCYKNDCKMSANLLAKDEQIEDRAHREISSVAAIFQIAMSKWNRRALPDNEQLVVFRLRKPLTPNEEADLLQNQRGGDPDDVVVATDPTKHEDDETWQTVMINHEKCSFIDCNERSKTANLETPIRELSHHSLIRCVAGKCTEDNTRDLQNTSFRFQETIRRTLNLINPLRV